MCETTVQVKCPHCHSANIVRNRHKKDNVQNYLCKVCRKQFIFNYQYHGANPVTKHLIISMLLRNSGIRDIEVILGVSRGCVFNCLILEAQKCVIIPKQVHYKSIQIDEHWRSAAQSM